MRAFVTVVPMMRAAWQWISAACAVTAFRTVRSMSYRGAAFGIVDGGKVVVYPTRSFRDMVRRHRAVAKAMRTLPTPPPGCLGPIA